MKIKSKNKIIKALLLVFAIVVIIANNNIIAVDMKSSRGNYIEKGQDITIILTFDYPIGAYDSIEVKYDSNILQYVSGDPIKESVWFDESDAQSDSITKKTYKFKGISDGTTNVSINVKGLVRANETMDVIGDINEYKNISVGKCGDINKDGIVNADDAADAIEIFKSNAQTKENIAVGDINNDGKVDAEDAALIIEYFKTHK